MTAPVTKNIMLPTNRKTAVFKREVVSATDDAIANIMPKKRSITPRSKSMAAAIMPRIFLKFTIMVDTSSTNLILF